MSASQTRRERLGGLVRAVIAESLLFEVKDPRLSAIDITDVVMSPDLGHAKVYYYARVDDAKLEQVQLALERAGGFLRRQVGQKVRARVTPELAFYYDDSIERGARIETLLREVKERDASLALEQRGDQRSLSELEEQLDLDQRGEQLSSEGPHGEG